jgi:hypothetical protein
MPEFSGSIIKVSGGSYIHAIFFDHATSTYYCAYPGTMISKKNYHLPKCKSHDLSCNAYFVQPILLYQPALLRYEVESVDCMHTSLQTFWQKHLTNCVVITKNKV